MTTAPFLATLHRARRLVGRLRRPDLRVIGVPRSGTNFGKYLIENKTGLKVAYDLGWWKHAVIPPLVSHGSYRPRPVPTLIMYREPVAQMVSFYKFARQGRTAIKSQAQDFSAFIRSPIRMQPYKGMEYWFADPVSYWIEYYWAALQWGGRKALIDLDIGRREPDRIIARLSAIMGRPVRVRDADLDLDRYIGRNASGASAAAWTFEKGTDLEREQARNADLLGAVSADDRAVILRPEAVDIYRRMLADMQSDASSIGA